MDLFNEIAKALKPEINSSLEDYIKNLVSSFDGYESDNFCEIDDFDYKKIKIDYMFKYKGVEYLIIGEKTMKGSVINETYDYPQDIIWQGNIYIEVFIENGTEKIMVLNYETN